MAPLSTLPNRPLCLSCMTRIMLTSFPTPSRNPSHTTKTTLRGKKTAAKKPTTINVRLLKDVVGYGRKGAIVPVAPGLFRNYWLPHKRAEYLSTLQGVKPRDVVAERDFSFGMGGEKEGEGRKEEEAPRLSVLERSVRRGVAVKRQMVEPERATEILEATIPNQILFYRVPISDPKPPSSSTGEQRKDASPAAAALAAASSPKSMVDVPTRAELETIFGSVSTSDMAEAIKAVLAGDDESARVVIAAEDIKIIGDGGMTGAIEGDRLKALGEFEVEIRVKGGGVMRRVVCVKAQDEV